MSVISALDFNNEVFRVYITWGGLLLIKLLLMAFLTGVQRFRKGAYENPEDLGGRENVEIKKDEDVERVRRAHLNDLENIPAFLLAGFFYVLTEPNKDLATILIRIAVLARIGHTIVSVKCKKFNDFNDNFISHSGLRYLSNTSTSTWNLLWHYTSYHPLHDHRFDGHIFPDLKYYEHHHFLTNLRDNQNKGK